MKERKIIAYGDSLTKNSYPGRLLYLTHQYLREKRDSFPVSVFRYGMSGAFFSENTTGPNALSIVLKEKHDACIVLGGTNDLECTSSILPEIEIREALESLYQGLVSVYQRLREGGIEPVLVTIPSALGPLGLEEVVDAATDERARKGAKLVKSFSLKKVEWRRTINDCLKEYAARERLHCADLFTATSTEEGFLRGEYAQDKVHFNEEGCQVMAQVIFEQGVKPLLGRYIEEMRTTP
ncbi:MAG TPA: SGNH/GDSL hydrolase family protein [Candidatus Nanoarchaeia archaeon]|nr:SGNH/GDSL hydrolase family protein [Candidatus Nanoarchaeia archaeon]